MVGAMGRISKAVVESAARQISQLDEDARCEMLEGLSKSQPVPVGFVISLRRMGLPGAELDHVLHVLLVIAECYRRTVRKGMPQITDEMLEASAKRVHATGQLIEGPSSEADRMTELVVHEHPEHDLFFYILGFLGGHGLIVSKPLHKEAVFGTAVVLEAFMQAAGRD